MPLCVCVCVCMCVCDKHHVILTDNNVNAGAATCDLLNLNDVSQLV